MSASVAVLDYGLGNLFSIRRALAHVGGDAEITASPQDVARAKGVVLPGVGAFADGMQGLASRGLIEALRGAVRERRPLLGICLGMQLLFDESEEFGVHQGLGVFRGRVVRLRDEAQDGARLKIPHIGWRELTPASGRVWTSTILEGLPPGEAMYFVHSYVPDPTAAEIQVAEMGYGGHRYCVVAEQEQVIGCQFHPEKSGESGLHLLRNFLARVRHA